MRALASRYDELHRDGAMTDLGTLGGLAGHDAAINRSGHVTGFAVTANAATYASIFQYGQMRDLNEPPCAPELVLRCGSSINVLGQIVGQIITAG